MGSYIPSSPQERRQMLDAVGAASMDDLFAALPEGMRLGPLNLPEGMAEAQVYSRMEEMAAKNKVFRSIFRGAGAYNHYIPAIVKSVVSKEEFLTAYTPYQAEISQGILQSIFEYQTMICELTGMDAANASVYDGASAAAEAAAMCRDRKRQTVLAAASANPMTLRTLATYCEGASARMAVVPVRDGLVDREALASMLDGSAACFYLQQPNYFGLIEDAQALGSLVHEAGAKFIMGVNPIAAALLKTPGECGADVAVGEGQPLGLPLAFGGPYLGFMAAAQPMMRKLPGRIVGETVDLEGRRAFVLTLQAREQHIRREKAASNICSNQALCAMSAAVYMGAMGPSGLREAARQCHSKAHYMARRLAEAGLPLRYSGEFFHEFVTLCPGDPEALLAHLEQRDILGGLPVEGGLLWCATECCTKAQIDALADAVKEALQ